MAPRRVAPISALALVSALILVGCTGDPTPSVAEELPDSSLISGAYANPLDPVMFPDSTKQSLITATLERLVGSCMTDAGFTYQTGDVFAKRRSAQDAQYTYSVTDPDAAAQYGFHPASWVKDQQELVNRVTNRPAGYDTALYGVTDKTQVTDDDGAVIATYDPDSCVGKAKDSVTPGWAQQDRIYNVAADILLAVSDKVAENDQVKAGNASWSECMGKAGYDYASPMDANNDEKFATDLPTAEEIPVAVASARCQHESGLLRTWSKVRAELTQAELDKHPGIVTQWLQMQDQAASHTNGN